MEKLELQIGTKFSFLSRYTFFHSIADLSIPHSTNTTHNKAGVCLKPTAKKPQTNKKTHTNTIPLLFLSLSHSLHTPRHKIFTRHFCGSLNPPLSLL